MPVTCHFLIVFDHEKQQLVEVKEFANAKAAVAAYEKAEEEHRGMDRLEIVLVGADSIDTVHVTHGQYFKEHADEFDRFLKLD